MTAHSSRAAAPDVAEAPVTQGSQPPPRRATPQRPPREGRWARLRRSETFTGYVALAPWFVGVFGLMLGPMVASLVLSFTKYDLLTAPSWTGLDNYIRMFTEDPLYMDSMRVTFLYVFTSVPLKLLLALLVAVALQKSFSGRGFYRAAFYLPSLLGTSVAAAILWRQMFSKQGFFNDFLGVFGLEGRAWVSHPDYALWTLVLLAVWQFGTPMVIFIAGLQQIPGDLYDAAAVDGAGPVRSFLRITVPMLTPIIFFNLVLEIIRSFQAFTSAFIVSGGDGGPGTSTLFYTLYLWQQGFSEFEMGYASAMAWVLFLIIAFFTAFTFRSSRYWVHYDDK